MNIQQQAPQTRTRKRAGNAHAAPVPPLSRFLTHCHSAFADEKKGSVASYIPELSKADPNHFGIAFATTDGHVYAAGDSEVPFTIQSISKAFVFALALEMLGADRVEATIGVEPSGDAFNSIRLRADNRPFNPMVNAGAIACSGLICRAEAGKASDSILGALGRFAGRELAVDETVFASERATGDRNRAIAYLLRNYSVIEDDVDAVLDVYFRQCSILVTARDLAVMAATLANGGVNPLTGERVISPYVVARTLSVMASSGMYDFAGEWMYRVGIPAKSGVGGGIIAALPSQLGIGTFSPPLDELGNSVRGLQVCHALSERFDLHMLNRGGDVRTCIVAEYVFRQMASRRMRQPHEQEILDAHADDIRVLELTDVLTFANLDYISRRLDFSRAQPEFLVLDLRRVPAITRAAAALLGEFAGDLTRNQITLIVSGLAPDSTLALGIKAGLQGFEEVRWFSALDESIEWAEDQVIYRHGGFSDVADIADLSEQALLAGLAPGDIDALAKLAIARHYKTGQRIIAAGDPAGPVYFLQRGMVSIKLGNGTRLASLVPGMAFGELALIDAPRTADVWADTRVECLELPHDRFTAFRERHPEVGERIMRNLAVLLAHRLDQANMRVDLLSAR
jgi:glutaminase